MEPIGQNTTLLLRRNFSLCIASFSFLGKHQFGIISSESRFINVYSDWLDRVTILFHHIYGCYRPMRCVHITGATCPIFVDSINQQLDIYFFRNI